MKTQTLELTVPAKVAQIICEAARKQGTPVSDWPLGLAVDSMTSDEQAMCRRAWAEVAMASYEAENGLLTKEEIGAAERVWKG